MLELAGSVKSLGTYDEVVAALTARWEPLGAVELFPDVGKDATQSTKWIDRSCGVGAVAWRTVEEKITGNGIVTVVQVKLGRLDALLEQGATHQKEVSDALFDE